MNDEIENFLKEIKRMTINFICDLTYIIYSNLIYLYMYSKIISSWCSDYLRMV